MPKTKKANTELVTEQTAAPAQETKPSVSKAQTEESMEKLVCLQYGGGEWSVADLEEKAIAAYVADGHRRGRIKKLTVYLKPEEHKIYYVINDKTTGSVDFE